MKILVTGANGFLGLHVVSDLLKKGHSVSAMIHEKSDVLKDLNCEKISADILNFATLENIIGEFDWIIHVAGAMSASPKDRMKLFRINVEGVRNIIRFAERKKAKLIHISSCVAVGANLSSDEPLLTENSVNTTVGKDFANYDSKRNGEELVLEAVKENRIMAVVLNPGLIYGAGDARKSIRKGNVLAAKGKLPFYTSGGVNIIHVDDVVKAIFSAMEKGRNGERYLITGDNITIKELLQTISLSAGAKQPEKKLPDFILKFFSFLISKENVFSATAFHWYDNSKAKRELNLNPQSYQKAIQSSVDWMKTNHYLDS